MHEAGIAVAVAAELRNRGLDPGSVSLLVRGGHGDPFAFDAALRMHVAAALGVADVDGLVIEHAPVPRLCAGCGGEFEAILPEDPCPACGGPGIALPVPEQIELVVADGPADRGPERPVADDHRLSAAAARDGHAGDGAAESAPSGAPGRGRGEG